MDLANLGITVDSSQLLRASENFDKFANVTRRLEQRMYGFTGGLADTDSALQRITNRMNGTTVVFKGFTNILQLVGGAMALKELKTYADTWSDINSRVKLAAGGVAEGADVMERLAQMARRSYSSLDDTAESYLGNATAMKELGYSTKQTLDYVESINNALVVSGAKGERAASVMNALSKAMALGKLSGDNLNTVISSGGRVAEALADSMGVTVNELRKLGSEGKITSDRIVSISKELEKLRAEAEQMPATIEDGFVLLGNSALKLVGQIDGAVGASNKFAEGLVYVADHLDIVAQGMLVFGGVAGARLFGPMIAGQTAALKSTMQLRLATVSGNAVLLNSRTAILQKAQAAKEAALSDQAAAKAALTAANAERVKAAAALEAAKASKIAGVAQKGVIADSIRSAAAQNYANAMKAADTAQISYNNSSAKVEATTKAAGLAMKNTTVTARALGLAMRGLNFIGGPVGAAILALGGALYIQAKRAEEAKSKSQALYDEWEKLGYAAPKLAENIQKISAALAASSGEVTRQIKETSEELQNLLKDTYGKAYLPFMGEDDSGARLDAVLTRAKQALSGSAEDSAALKTLEDITKTVKLLPSEAGKAKEAVKELLTTNVSSNVANVLKDAISSLEKVEAATNKLAILGSDDLFKRLHEQAKAFKEDLLNSPTQGTIKDDLIELVTELDAGKISAEQFAERLNKFSTGTGLQGLIDRARDLGENFQKVKEYGEGIKKILEDIRNEKVNIAVSFTFAGVGGDFLKDLPKNIEDVQKEIEKNYPKLLKDLSMTAKHKELEAIKKELTGGKDIALAEQKGLDAKAEDIYKRRHDKDASKSAQRDADAYRDLIKSSKDRVEQLEIEAQYAGLNGIASDTMRMKLELEQKARGKSTTITKAQAAEIDSLSKSYERAAEAAAKARLKEDMSFEWRQMGRDSIERRVADQLRTAGLAENLNSYEAAQVRILEVTKRNQQAWQSFGDTAEDALYRMIAGTGDWRDALTSLLPTVKDLLLQISGLSDNKYSLGGILSNILAGGGGGGGRTAMSSAMGFTPLGGFDMFAKGGMFTNSIVDRPTPFRFANGGGFSNGLMGEAGPEAILPLHRDVTGQLGVAARVGGGGGQSNISVQVEPSPYFDVKVKEISNGQIQEAAPEIVKQSVKQSDSNFASNYREGLRRSSY